MQGVVAIQDYGCMSYCLIAYLPPFKVTFNFPFLTLSTSLRVRPAVSHVRPLMTILARGGLISRVGSPAT
jgi:hypothetical protein